MPYTKDEIHATILHEMGHGLGLTWHSESPGDVMYFATQDYTQLSVGDKQTIQQLYASETHSKSEVTRYIRALQ